MLGPATTESLPPVDAWLISPLPLQPFEIRRRERSAVLAERRRIRYLYFDLGGGQLRRLASPADQQAVRSAQKDAYAAYRSRCVVESRPPLRYLQYLHCWRAWQKRVWLKHDVPRVVRARLGMTA